MVLSTFSRLRVWRKRMSVSCPTSFLDQLAGMPQKNLALETLRKLLNDQIRSRERVNIVQSRGLSGVIGGRTYAIHQPRDHYGSGDRRAHRSGSRPSAMLCIAARNPACRKTSWHSTTRSPVTNPPARSSRMTPCARSPMNWQIALRPKHPGLDPARYRPRRHAPNCSTIIGQIWLPAGRAGGRHPVGDSAGRVDGGERH